MGFSLRVGVLVASGLLAGGRGAQAQTCPTAACVPGAASLGSTTLAANAKMGIYNVTLGSISNATGGYTEGYKDYSCTQQATLPVTAPATITITNGTLVNENVRVWIDYDNNGTFDETAELAFASATAAKTHTGTITPPATAVLGTPLRLRVASDYSGSPVPGPCTTPQYSQDEDYAVVLTTNSQPPVAAFTEDATTTCTGTVQFTDQSANGPTAWQWYFGDGGTSTAQNPSHTYATAGTYQVQLTATNAAGNSTSAATAITYNPSVPVAAACPGLPAVSWCCGYGILRVRLGSIDNTSADGSVGYQDFTCPQRTTLTAGDKATLRVTTSSSLQHNTSAWLDANNDGSFTDNERVVNVASTISPSATFTVPGTAVLGQPLRFRIVADALPNVPGACTAPQQGQVEDYTVTVLPNTKAPTAAFTSDYVAGSCATPSNTYTFTDTSTDGPTTWQWSFGPATGITYVNGTSATSPNPQVNFSVAGTYAVTLTVANANGSNTVTVANYLTINVPCVAYCASNGGGNAGGPGGGGASQFWITRVEMTAAPGGGAAFSNSSQNTSSGYTFYSSPAIVVQGGATQTLAVTVNRGFIHRVSVWIDYDRSGTFDNATELVYNGLSQQNMTRLEIPVTFPASVATTRMRIQATLNNNTPNPCATNLGQAEVEDYTITPLVLAVRESQALPGLTVGPVPSPDGHLRVALADAQTAAGPYTVQVCNVLGATLRQTALRLGPAPADLDLSELPAGLYLLRFTDAQGHTGLRRVVRQ